MKCPLCGCRMIPNGSLLTEFKCNRNLLCGAVNVWLSREVIRAIRKRIKEAEARGVMRGLEYETPSEEELKQNAGL
jgi:hypothetical protein